MWARLAGSPPGVQTACVRTTSACRRTCEVPKQAAEGDRHEWPVPLAFADYSELRRWRRRGGPDTLAEFALDPCDLRFGTGEVCREHRVPLRLELASCRASPIDGEAE